MMSWTVVMLIVVGIIVKFIMTPPSALVKWVLSKFAIHPNFNAKEVTVIFSGEPLEEDEKVRFINYFNEARFLKEYEIFPGNEDLFLHPKTDVVPFVIHAKKNNKDVTIFVYSYDDHIDVVKQHKGKVASYSLRSDELQEFTVAAKRLYAMQ